MHDRGSSDFRMKQMRLCLALGFLARVRGMLGRDDLPGSSDAILIAPCRSVHTFGMRRAIDVAFLDEFGRVVLVRRGLLPHRCVWSKEAVCVIERFSHDGKWLEEGERVLLGA